MISREDAVGIARARVEADGVMALESRDTVVGDEEGYWHVSFPLRDLNVRGGEPHVRVRKADGAVTLVTYSQ